jgi:hypothetical protein
VRHVLFFLSHFPYETRGVAKTGSGQM